MRSAGVIGTGLIGGSIAAGLTAAGWDVVGYDTDPISMEIVLDRGFIGSAAGSVEELIDASPDIVIIAAPPKATIEILANIDTSLTIMDVAGVKVEVMDAATHLKNFVGTHPMAGRETTGPKTASAALFRGANWVVIEESPPDSIKGVTRVLEVLGANLVMMSANQHDRAVAAISHLPQVLAAGLLSSASKTPGAIDLAAGSFRDLTRVAASQPLPWVELLRSNRDAVLEAIDGLCRHLRLVEAAIASDDDELFTHLSDSREMRRSLGAPVVAVRVSLADEPGEFAKVGHALEEAHVDLRDLQMRHSPHGGGGVLTLSVRSGEEEALRHALSGEGLQTIL